VGVCIHELRLKIQNADSVVPAATISVATMCTRSDTRPRPNSITPRKVASRKEGGQHLVAQQRPGDVAHLFHEARPVGAELEAHGDADTTPSAKLRAKTLVQK
jgi:hypothetical protein